MGALSYLVAMQTKNRFLKFVRSPGKVIYAVVLFFAAVMSFVSSDLPSHSQLRDVRELYVILLAFYTFAFINIAKNGEISFTEEGAKKAGEIHERHEVITAVFIKLGADTVVAEENACRVEHVISPELMQVLKNFIQK